MKCSNCQREIRPVAAIDIDGTLGDWHKCFLQFAVGWLGLGPSVEVPPYDGVVPFRDWTTETFGIDLTTFRQLKLAFRQGGIKRMMSMYPHADDLVNGLREHAEVWLTTNRPHDRYDRIDPDTREWLRRHGIGFDGLLYSDHKMEELAERVGAERVCFVLDDLAGTLERAKDLFPGAGLVLRTNQYNSGVRWMVRTGSLLDARAMATAHAQDWALSHHFDELPTTTNEGS